MSKAPAPAQRPRRRERKNIASGVAHVNATFNNTQITITDAQGNADRKSTRLNSSHVSESRMPSSA
mgnify:CR=1 FL=1